MKGNTHIWALESLFDADFPQGLTGLKPPEWDPATGEGGGETRSRQ